MSEQVTADNQNFIQKGVSDVGFYRECPHCGANLDPGERCECQSEKEKERTAIPTKESCSENQQIVLTTIATPIITRQRY